MRDPLAPSTKTLFALLALFTILWFGGLEFRVLQNPDEGRYAEIAREMATTGDWVTPRLNGLKYLEKPPLQYWITAVAFQAFGVHAWTARLWSALSTFLAVLFLGYVGARLAGRTLGVYASSCLAGNVGFVLSAHVLTLDGGLAALLTLASGVFVLAQREGATTREQNHWMCIAWVALAGATLTKGPIGVVIPVASLMLYSLVTRDTAIWTRLYARVGLIIYVALAIPWFVAVALANEEFLEFFFVHEHFIRFLTTQHQRVKPWWYFVPLLILGGVPWITAFGLRTASIWRDGTQNAKGFSWQRFSLIWAAFVFIFFSASGSKLGPYILPMFPPLALVAAWMRGPTDEY